MALTVELETKADLLWVLATVISSTRNITSPGFTLITESGTM